MVIQSNDATARSHHRPLSVGLFLPHAERQLDGKTPRWNDIVAMAQRAEAVGFDSVWVADHFLSQIQPRFGPAWKLGQWECWSMLAALAASTRRVQLGPLVSSTSFRNPTLLAKMAATVDEISGGRLILGLGAGWLEYEYRAFGYPFDHRVSRFEEALTIIHALLRTGEVDFQGTYYQARECELRPRGPRPTGPPIMIGTTGERMLRLTARHADLWNGWLIFGDSRPDAVDPMLAKLDLACADVGRDPDTIGRTVSVTIAPPDVQRGLSSHVVGRIERLVQRRFGIEAIPISGSPEAIAETLRRFAAKGISHVQVKLQPNSLASIEAFAPVLERLDLDRAVGVMEYATRE